VCLLFFFALIAELKISTMSKKLVTLESLIETHDLPFVIIDKALKIVAVNRAWEKQFNFPREQQIGKPCCAESGNCRHQHLFDKLEPYAGLFPRNDVTSSSMLKVRGYPLLDSDGQIYIGESISVVTSSELTANSPMVGSSPAFLALQNKLSQAAQTQAPVLLMGETGTGKEIASEFIHRNSKNAEKKFVIMDCTILGENLFESELFGHEKGSFTGASTQKKGLFELADNGTLFLDEVGELPLSQQPKLLRALESGQFRRVGGTTQLSSKVRLVCATHRNLSNMVSEGLFREDLFYRLSVFQIEMPPLRKRKQDIPGLCAYLLDQFGQINECTYSISKQAMTKLLQHQWPGNIRELKNCLHLAINICSGYVIEEQDINIVQREPLVNTSDTTMLQENVHVTQSNAIDEFEARFITELHQKHRGNRKLIADEMNISERTLYRKLKRFNLN
jgi:transcriptional regulator with PAS, ATPase and Fis domain